MNLICFTVAVFLVLSTNLAYGFQCFIVDGRKEDVMKVYNSPAIDKPLMKNGVICKVIDGWSYFENWKPSKDEKILIIQHAHGIPGGGATTNEGETSEEKILHVLNKLSETNQVSAYLETCYSGDLIKKKLIEDEKDPASTSINNLCLVTTSVFGRISYGRENLRIGSLLSSNMSETMIDFFKGANQGLITASPWSTSGVTDYVIKNEITEKTKEFLQEFNELQPNSYADEVCRLAYSKNGLSSVELNSIFCSLGEKDYVTFTQVLEEEQLMLSRTQNGESIDAYKGFVRSLLNKAKEIKALNLSSQDIERCEGSRTPVRCILPKNFFEEKCKTSNLDFLSVLMGRVLLASDKSKVVRLNIDPAITLHNWSKNSLKGPQVKKNELDRRRYEACANFNFE